MKSLLWNLGLVLASSINFAGAFLLAFFWKINLVLYCVIVVVLSCLLGTMMVDVKKSLVSVYVSMVLGLVITVALTLAPHLAVSQSAVMLNLAVIAVFTILGKLILVSIIFYFLGALFGCFIGESYGRR